MAETWDGLSPLVRGLAAYLDTDGHPLEPDTAGGRSPEDHYAAVFTALALHVDPQCGDWRAPLDAWAALPPTHRGHEPFNRLGLRLLERRIQRTSGAAADLDRVRAALRGCPLKRRYPSNNWTLLAATVRLLEARSPAARTRCVRRIVGLTDHWMTDAGGFIDFPARRCPRPATPVAYHLKALLCLWIAACEVHDPRLEDRLERGLGWLQLVATRGGYCGGLGRSNHALFGDACLLAVLDGMRLAATGPVSKQPPAGSARWPDGESLAAALKQRLVTQRRDDGLFWLTPACRGGREGGWDSYMQLSVYNAWLAGLLSLVADRDPALTGGRVRPMMGLLPAGDGASGRVAIARDDTAGLVRADGADWSICISLRGQAVQGYSRQVGDLRAAGGLPFHLEIDGQPMLPTPIRQDASRWRSRPWEAGWLLLVISGGAVYGPLQFERTGWSAREEGIAWWGEGNPVALWRAPSRSWWQRVRDSLDWRVLGGALQRRIGVEPPRLSDHRWRLEAEWDGATRLLRVRWTLFGRAGSSTEVLNPAGWSVFRASDATSQASAVQWGTAATSLGDADAGCGSGPVLWPREDQTWSASRPIMLRPAPD